VVRLLLKTELYAFSGVSFWFYDILKICVTYEFKFTQFAVTEKIFKILMKGLNSSVNVWTSQL